MSRIWPNRLDARINRAVQCRNSQVRAQVEQRLQQEGLLSATGIPGMPLMRGKSISRECEFLGFAWKLLAGSCILRVDSPRRQWYHERLKPWVHLVPIRADLSDLGEQLDWCNNHLHECKAIAAAGKAQLSK